MTAPQDPARRGSSGTVVLGAILIALGLVFFAGQQLNIDLADAAWPFYVIAPGLALVAFGLTQARGSGLTIAGSMLAMIGLVLLYQNATDQWESWAYAWALVAPGGSGIGMLLYGTRSGDARMARDGFFTILTAIGLFAAGLVFFEGIIGISGERLPLPQWALPAAIIVIGLLLLLRGFTARRVVLEPSAPAQPAAAPADASAEAESSDSPEEPQAPPAT